MIHRIFQIMKPRGSRFKGLALYAEHEQAKRERSNAEDEGTSYEVKRRRSVRRKQAQGWAEEVLTEWLEDISATDINLERVGADLLCVACSDIGDVAVTMLTPFQASFEVRAICEPWLVRAELGERPGHPSAWAIDVEHESCVLVSAISTGWCGVLAMPRVRTGLLSFLDGGAVGLYRRQVRAALDGAVELATIPSDRSRDTLWTASQASTIGSGRGRWVKLKRRAANRHIRSPEAEAVVAGLRSCGFFESLSMSRGDATRWAAATIVEGPPRDIEPAPITYDGMIRARSKGWGVVMDIDIFRFAHPLMASSDALLTPSSWAVARLSIDERSGVEAFRLSDVPGLVGACFWMSGDELLAGGFAKRVEQLVKEALSGHDGPYR